MGDLVTHIQNSLNRTDVYQSKITDDILLIDGMSGKKTRHFYNNICSMDDARYLEVGVWKGSSISSAMCNNKMTCLCIDNWSEFAEDCAHLGPRYVGVREEFFKNFNRFKGENDATFLEKDCFDVDTNEIGKFNIYMYDGNHSETSHFLALNYFMPCLDNIFIYLVDDWNWKPVRDGTLDSIEKNNAITIWKKEIRTTSDDSSAFLGDWHNGICIFVLKKS